MKTKLLLLLFVTLPIFVPVEESFAKTYVNNNYTWMKLGVDQTEQVHQIPISIGYGYKCQMAYNLGIRIPKQVKN